MLFFFLLGRILFGGFFVLSGLKHFTDLERLAEYARSKNVPAARLAVIAAGALLLIGGWGILFGIYIPAAVAALAIFLLPVSIVMHNFWAESGVQRMGDLINFQKNMALLGGALLLLFIPTPWSISL